MNYYAGIDLGGTFIKCGLVDETGNIICKDKIPTARNARIGKSPRIWRIWFLLWPTVRRSAGRT